MADKKKVVVAVACCSRGHYHIQVCREMAPGVNLCQEIQVENIGHLVVLRDALNDQIEGKTTPIPDVFKNFIDGMEKGKGCEDG